LTIDPENGIALEILPEHCLADGGVEQGALLRVLQALRVDTRGVPRRRQHDVLMVVGRARKRLANLVGALALGLLEEVLHVPFMVVGCVVLI
jgi:hypothetical protein